MRGTFSLFLPYFLFTHLTTKAYSIFEVCRKSGILTGVVYLFTCFSFLQFERALFAFPRSVRSLHVLELSRWIKTQPIHCRKSSRLNGSSPRCRLVQKTRTLYHQNTVKSKAFTEVCQLLRFRLSNLISMILNFSRYFEKRQFRIVFSTTRQSSSYTHSFKIIKVIQKNTVVQVCHSAVFVSSVIF